jgi:hypothetical protein
MKQQTDKIRNSNIEGKENAEKRRERTQILADKTKKILTIRVNLRPICLNICANLRNKVKVISNRSNIVASNL